MGKILGKILVIGSQVLPFFVGGEKKKIPFIKLGFYFLLRGKIFKKAIGKVGHEKIHPLIFR
jgi:hypothetical protein